MELSEPEHTTARFQAVVSSLLAPERGARLLACGPREARLLLGADLQRGTPVLVQVLQSQGEDAAALSLRIQPLLAELLASRGGDPQQRFHLRIIVVTPPADADAADATLRALCAEAPPSPVLQAFQVSSSGAVRSQSGLTFSEVGPALRDQAKSPVQPATEAAFAARCQEAIQQTRESHRQLRDFTQLLQQRRTPATYGLLGLSLVLFALTYVWGGPDQLATLGRMGAASVSHILAGQWWRLLAATALHGGLLHLGFNSLGLWNLGVLLEKLLGSARFLSLYVLSGLCGSLLGVALAERNVSSIGASGAIYGLLAASAALGLRPRGDLPEAIAQSLKRMALANLGLAVIASLQAHVDWRAHLGGALAGAALILSGLLRPTVAREAQPRWRDAGQVILAAAAAGALLVSIGVAIGRGQPWLLTHPTQRHRVALAGTPLSLEVPRAFGAGVPGTSGEGSSSLIFADPVECPAVLALSVVPNSPPLESSAARQGLADLLWQDIEEDAAGSNKALAAHRFTADGFPAVALSGTLPRGIRIQKIIQVRTSYRVTLQLQAREDTPQRLLPDLQELLATMKDEPR